MGISSSEHAVDDEPLLRLESIPPDGEDVHACVTKVGDWALELEEVRRASTAGQATAKVNAFDLAAVLEKAKRRSIAPQAPISATPGDAPPASSVLGLGLEHVPEALMIDDLDGLLVVEEVTIDVEEERSSRALRSGPGRKAERSTSRFGRRFLDVFVALAVIAAFAMTLSR